MLSQIMDGRNLFGPTLYQTTLSFTMKASIIKPTLYQTTLAFMMKASMPSQLAGFTWSCKERIELCLPMWKVTTRWTTSGSTSKVSRTVWYESLDEDLNDIICYSHPQDNPTEQWCIAIPQQMLQSMVHWLHQFTGHPWEKHLRKMLQPCYYHPKLRFTVDRFKCEHHQNNRLSGKGYGSLLEWEMWIAPCEEVANDLIGPWMVKVDNQKVKFNALVCINTAWNLVELIQVDNKMSHQIRDKFVEC